MTLSALPLKSVVVGLTIGSVFHASAATISFTGNLRADATFLPCGAGCTLSAGDSDADFAQWAAVVRGFDVASTSTMQAITFSYGGGINGQGTVIPQSGF